MLYLSFLEFDTIWITSCSGKPDPCMEALNESLKDLECQKKSQSWLPKVLNNTFLGGKMPEHGTWAHSLRHDRPAFKPR